MLQCEVIMLQYEVFMLLCQILLIMLKIMPAEFANGYTQGLMTSECVWELLITSLAQRVGGLDFFNNRSARLSATLPPRARSLMEIENLPFLLTPVGTPTEPTVKSPVNNTSSPLVNSTYIRKRL